jgi:hypothetical protein
LLSGHVSGDQGLGVLAVGSPSSQRYGCDRGAPTGGVEPTTSAGDGLAYDPFTGQYSYIQKTSKGWAGQCRTLTVALNDGTAGYTANFKFK